ncbi:MAG: AAA family ATPase [Candidatus Margulisiibacteriota bacterium]
MKRTIEAELFKWNNKPDRKPLVLRGARQVGKTYSLKYFGEHYFPSFHYINFEKDESLASIFEKDLDPKRIVKDLSFYLNTSIDLKNDLLIFDEIQYVPKALTSLKYFYEEYPSLAICCAGSLLGLHLSDDAFPVGKVEFLNMYPMSFEEFLLAAGDARSIEILSELNIKSVISDIIHDHLWEELKKYFVVGGLPEVVKTYIDDIDNQFDAMNRVRAKQNDLIMAYIADMAKHSGKQNAMHIERIWRNIPAQLARAQDGTSAKYQFKGVVPGIKRYAKLAGSLDWLETAGLIIKTYIINKGEIPFSAYSKESQFKLYLFDVGILGALSELPVNIILDYDYGSYKGYFAENFAAQEFLYSGVQSLYCWQGRTSEVEFVREYEGDILPIEVKSGWVTQSKSLKIFAEKYEAKYRSILSANNFKIDFTNKVHRYPIYLASRFPLKEI